MQINSPVIIIAGLLIIALIVFLIMKNKKDRKELENQLNQDYRKPSGHPNAKDTEDVKGD